MRCQSCFTIRTLYPIHVPKNKNFTTFLNDTTRVCGSGRSQCQNGVFHLSSLFKASSKDIKGHSSLQFRNKNLQYLHCNDARQSNTVFLNHQQEDMSLLYTSCRTTSLHFLKDFIQCFKYIIEYQFCIPLVNITGNVSFI